MTTEVKEPTCEAMCPDCGDLCGEPAIGILREHVPNDQGEFILYVCSAHWTASHPTRKLRLV